MDLSNKDFNMLIFTGFRYCLGRRTYIVSWFVEVAIKYASYIDNKNKKLMIKEIKEAIEDNQAGQECDVTDWITLMNIIEREMK